MEVKIYIPHLALKEYILNISTINIILPNGINDVVTPYPPTPFQSIIFYCSHPVSMSREGAGQFTIQPLTAVIGPQISRVNIKVQSQLSAIRVDFAPGGLFRLLGIPMNELFDEGFNAIDFFGAEMNLINNQLADITNLEDGKNIVENFLLSKITRLKQILPFDAALQYLLHHNGNVSIDKIALLSCLSLKQFERKCKERLGMTPKLYARILKFSKAYRLHEASPTLSWTNIAYEAGYYDQMHMIKDFKTFAGVNPSIIERQLLSSPIRMQKDLRY
jgi:AraC-like DNA-binding protein